jgi:sensor histidine kinase YesM
MLVKGDSEKLDILPLLLIQFVENAFKHGMKEKSDKNWMKVNIDIRQGQLLFQVDNSFYGIAAEEGIGINSVRRILDLQYEGKYELTMQRSNNRFSVTLKLNLT